MINLSSRAGFPLQLDTSPLVSLHFGQDVEVEETLERKVSSLAPVLLEPLPSEEQGRVVYTVFRAVGRRQNREQWGAAGLRYDLTFIPPGRIGASTRLSTDPERSRGVGREFAKTFGHVHKSEGAEFYQVLHGRAYALLERWSEGRVSDAVLVEAGPGETFLVQSGFGHVTINPFDAPLVLANVVPRDLEQDYSPYERHHGASYYIVESELGQNFIDIVPNPNLPEHPELKKARPHLPEALNTLKEKPLYSFINLVKSDKELAQFILRSHSS